MSRKSFVNLTDGIVNVSMLIIQIKPRRLHRPAKPFKRTIHGRRSLVYSHSDVHPTLFLSAPDARPRLYTRLYTRS